MNIRKYLKVLDVQNIQISIFFRIKPNQNIIYKVYLNRNIIYKYKQITNIKNDNTICSAINHSNEYCYNN